MFQLNLVDHIRLSYDHLLQSYEANRRMAERLERRGWIARVFVLVALAASAAAALAVALQSSSRSAVVVAALAGAAFLVYGLAMALDVEPGVSTHRLSAARLWLLCERYRSLLAEIEDGLVDASAVAARRDALIRDVHAVYEYAGAMPPPAIVPEQPPPVVERAAASA
jgi:hypothetical protein